MALSDDPRDLQFEMMEIDAKLQAASVPAELRTASDRRYFSRLLAGLRRRREKLKSLSPAQIGW